MENPQSITDLLKEIPLAIPFTVNMNSPNEKIEVYSGDFTLRSNGLDIKCNGVFKYEWYPTTGVNVTGQAFNVTNEELSIFRGNDAVEVYIDKVVVGEVYITRLNISTDPTFKGAMHHSFILGDKTIPIDTLRFCVPNLKDFIGDPIKFEGKTLVSNGRISFETSQYIINIDKHPDYKKRQESLHSEGGYLLLYSGEIKAKKGGISHSDSLEILQCLNFFLTFINGAQVSGTFLEGSHNGNVIWKDFTNFISHQYLAVMSWTDAFALRDFASLWKSFYDTWKTKDGHDFLKKAVHWYVEANYSSVFAESKIIITQAGLELVFNWHIIEKQKLIVGKDSESISAINKIRLLVHQLKLDFSIPVGLSHIHSKKEYKDGPEVFVNLRNAIVHQQEEKRKKLNELPVMVIYEVYKLGIWYLELSILFILNYNGRYCNRTIFSPGAENVPWVEKKISSIV
jgi:hypothetical protein